MKSTLAIMFVLCLTAVGCSNRGDDPANCLTCASPIPAATVPPVAASICQYLIISTPRQIGANGTGQGDDGFSVSTTPQSCPWIVVPNVPWIGLKDQPGPTGKAVSSISGVGNGHVTYVVAGNGGVSRTGTVSGPEGQKLVPGDQKLTIVQAGR